MRVILASGSPRRKELLERINVAFGVIVPDVDETALSEGITSPAVLVKKLSEAKAEVVFASVSYAEPFVVIAADTVVAAGGRVLGKPKDADEAKSMLKSLQGREHRVHTGVCVIFGGGDVRRETFVETTSVYMRRLSQEDIDRYVATGEPMDKAGAYAAQGYGALLIERVDGDFYNVVGLPIYRLYRILGGFNVDNSRP